MQKKKLVIFSSNDGNVTIDVHLENDTVWLTQRQISNLFNKDIRTVNEHINNVFTEGELDKEPTIRKFWIV